MRVCGWTVAELRAAPASVIRAHFARIYAGLVWSPRLLEAALGPTPQREHYRSLADYARARDAKQRAAAAFEEQARELWPEDD
jgi:hypothetical protein